MRNQVISFLNTSLRSMFNYLGCVEVFECKKTFSIFHIYNCLETFFNISQFIFPSVTMVKQQMVIYLRHFVSRAVFSHSYFGVPFCFYYIKLTIWANTLINNIFFVDDKIFQHNERCNISCFPKISKFYFIVKCFQFVNNARNLIFISFQANFFSLLD